VKWHLRSVLIALDDQPDSWDSLAVITAKSVNNEPGLKVRETWSGENITRELPSMYDRQGIPLASFYKGVNAWKLEFKVNSIFETVCEMTQKVSVRWSLVTSLDDLHKETGWHGANTMIMLLKLRKPTNGLNLRKYERT
jgi:hypothetical protein